MVNSLDGGKGCVEGTDETDTEEKEGRRSGKQKNGRVERG